jgi:hypothetical protein
MWDKVSFQFGLCEDVLDGGGIHSSLKKVSMSIFDSCTGERRLPTAGTVLQFCSRFVKDSDCRLFVWCLVQRRRWLPHSLLLL